MRIRRAFFACWPALLLMACQRERTSSETVRSTIPTWTLDTLAVTDIDAPADNSPHPIAHLGGMARLSDGRFVIMDVGASEVRIVDVARQVTSITGRRGDGPGEFRFARDVGVCTGDSIAVFQAGRLSLLDPKGAFARSVTVPPAAGTNETPIAIDRQDCMRSLWLRRSPLPLDSTGWLGQQHELLWRSGADTQPVARYAGLTRYRTQVDGQPAMLSIPWSGSPAVAVHDGVVALSTMGGSTVRFFAGTSAPRDITWNLPSMHVTTADLQRYDSTRTAWIAEEPRYATSLVPSVSLPVTPTVKPPIATMLMAESGDIWVRAYPTGTDGLDQAARSRGHTEQWHVMRPDTEAPIAAIAIPTAFRPKIVTADTVFGVWTDDDRGQMVRAFPLRHR
ncbi:hypothetical protein [Gemmatimonas aurantiaca]|uniref:hypothetical protein n=1 Tax=Gemmatimonas aurantiaca TaxID=173480 RepID=UPI00301DF0A4